MAPIKYTKHFNKVYASRIEPNRRLEKKFKVRFEIFINNRENPVLKDHGLSGKYIGIRAFSITGDIRVLYSIDEESILLLDVGSHNQVYK